MPSKSPLISDAEWDVMDVVWRRASSSAGAAVAASDVVEAVAGRRGWSPRTVKTLLARLVKKNALATAADGNRYLYRPRVAREACVRSESRSFLARVFGGRAGEMLCRFVDEAELSPREIAELKKILDRKRGGR